MAKIDTMGLMAASAGNITAAAKNQSIRKVEGSTDSFGQYMAKKDNGSDVPEKIKEKLSEKDLSGKKDLSLEPKGNQLKKKEYVSDLENGNVSAAGSMTVVQANQVVQEIREIVKEELSTDDVTIDQTLKSMGITVLDLLNPDVLKSFVLELNGAETMDLLTDEKLLASLQNLMDLLQDYAEENDPVIKALMDILSGEAPAEENVEPEQFETLVKNLTGDAEAEVKITTVPEEQNALAASVPEKKENTEAFSETTAAPEEEGKEPAEGIVERLTVLRGEGKQQESGEQPQDFNGNLQGKEATEEGSLLKGTILHTEETPEAETVSTEEILPAADAEAEDGKELHVVEEEHAPYFAVNGHEHVVQGNVNDIAQANFQSAGRMLQALDIMRQIGEQMRTSLSEGETRLEMQLNPESLGKVLLTVSSKEGMMTATFRVQTEEARQALESQMFQLKENLEAKNIKVDAVDVQISNFTFTEYGEAERQKKEAMEQQGKRKFDFDVAEEEEDAEEMAAEAVRRSVMRDRGGSIDYTA